MAEVERDDRAESEKAEVAEVERLAKMIESSRRRRR